MNGIAPPEAAPYLLKTACCAEVGVCKEVYPPLAGSGMLVCVSTGVNVRYLLVNLALAKVRVEVFGNGSALPAPFLAAL